MWCKDPFLALLRDYGYNVVRLPRANIAPLLILSRDGSDLGVLGGLASVVTSTQPLPTITADVQATGISGSKAKTGGMEGSLGVTLLGNVIAAMGGPKLGLGAAYKQASTITFEFLDVKQDSIDITALDAYLSAGQVNPNSRAVGRQLKENGIYVLTSTIKSQEILVRASSSSGGDVALDATQIQQIVGGKIKVEGEGKHASALVFKGEEYLVFGFQAVQLLYDKSGDFETYKRVAADALAMRGGLDEPAGAEAPGDLVLLDTAKSPFVHLLDPETKAAEVSAGRRALIGINDYPNLEARHQLKGASTTSR
ncbi:MAG: hypothetical protein WKF75_00725 [Singulisphaera sp.]